MCFTLPPVRRRSRTPVRDKGVISAAVLDLVCKQERDSAMKALQAEILQLKAENASLERQLAYSCEESSDLDRHCESLLDEMAGADRIIMCIRKGHKLQRSEWEAHLHRTDDWDANEVPDRSSRAVLFRCE